MELNMIFDVTYHPCLSLNVQTFMDWMEFRPAMGSSSFVTLEMMGRITGWKRADWIASNRLKTTK